MRTFEARDLAAGALMVALSIVLWGCGAGGSGAGPGSDGSGLLSPKQGFSNTSCSPKPCAVGTDAVAVSVSQIAHTKTADGRPLLEFNLRVVNGSSAELGVSPESQVSLILTDRNEVGMDPSDGPQALGLIDCYGNLFMGGSDTEIYHLQPGESLTVPKKLCFILDPGKAAVASVRFSDENGTAPEVVNIG
jgi:hypothetical protein